MKYTEKYDHSYWMNKVDKMYEGSKFEIKMNKFCKDIKITTYRMKKIVENKAHFLNPEQDRIIDVLDIKDNEIKKCFHKKIEA